MAWIISQEAGTAADTVPAKKSADKAAPPLTICHTIQATEEPAFSAVFRCEVDIVVRSPAYSDSGTPEATSDTGVAAVFDAFHTSLDTAGDKLGEAITTAARAVATGDDADLLALTILDVRPVSESGSFNEDGTWEDSLRLEIVAVPSNVS